jgi:predicted RND superfamily exporter protein
MAAFSVWAMSRVNINYNLAGYLPDDSDTRAAIDIMEEEFGLSGQAEIMIRTVTVEEALSLKKRIEALDNAVMVTFFNDPSYFYDTDGNGVGDALFKIVIDGDDYSANAEGLIADLKEEFKLYDIALNGQAVSNLDLKNRISGEMTIMFILAIIIVAAVLIFTSKSLLEPIIIGAVIGISVLINLGSNMFLGEISYIVKSIAAILQMALAMDYSIVTMHNYKEIKEHEPNAKIAMAKALKKSFSVVSASSLTTIASLFAIVFMTFKIGADIGVVMIKALVISVLTVFLLMPGLIVLLNKSIEKFKFEPLKLFRSKKPKTNKGTYVKFLNKTKKIVPLVMLVIVAGCFVLQSQLKYEFLEENKKRIPNDVVTTFGPSVQVYMTLPKAQSQADYDKQIRLTEMLLRYYNESGEKMVKDVLSYPTTVAREMTSDDAARLMNIDPALMSQLFGTYYLENGMLQENRISMKSFLDFAAEIIEGKRQISASADIASAISGSAEYILLLNFLLKSSDTAMTAAELTAFIKDTGEYGVDIDAEAFKDYIIQLYGMKYYDEYPLELGKMTLKEFLNYTEGLLTGKINSGIDLSFLDENTRAVIIAFTTLVNNLDRPLTADAMFDMLISLESLLGIDISGYREYIYILYGNYFFGQGTYKLPLDGLVKYIFKLLEGGGIISLDGVISAEDGENILRLKGLIDALDTQNSAEDFFEAMARLAYLAPGLDISELYIRQLYGNYLYKNNGAALPLMSVEEFILYADGIASSEFADLIEDSLKSQLSLVKYFMSEALPTYTDAVQFFDLLNSQAAKDIVGDVTLTQTHINIIYALYTEKYNLYDGTSGVYADFDIAARVEGLYINTATFIDFLAEKAPILLGIDASDINLLKLFGSTSTYYTYGEMSAYLNGIFALASILFVNLRNIELDEPTTLLLYKLYHFEKNPAFNYNPTTAIPTHTLMSASAPAADVIAFTARLLNGDPSKGYYDSSIYNATVASYIEDASYVDTLIGISEAYAAYTDGQGYSYTDITDILQGISEKVGMTTAIDVGLSEQVYIMYDTEYRPNGISSGEYKIQGREFISYLADIIGADEGFLGAAIAGVLNGGGMDAHQAERLLRAFTGEISLDYSETAELLTGIMSASAFDADLIKQAYILYFIQESPSEAAFLEGVMSLTEFGAYMQSVTDESDAEYIKLISDFLGSDAAALNGAFGMLETVGIKKDLAMSAADLTGFIAELTAASGVNGVAFSAEETKTVYIMYAIRNGLVPVSVSRNALKYTISEMLLYMQALSDDASDTYSALISRIAADAFATIADDGSGDTLYTPNLFVLLSAINDFHSVYVSARTYDYERLSAVISGCLDTVSGELTALTDGAGLTLDASLIEQVYVKYFVDYGRFEALPIRVSEIIDFTLSLTERPLISDFISDEHTETLTAYKEQLAIGEKMFNGENFSRMIFVLNVKDGSPEGFAFVDTMRNIAAIVYGDEEIYLAGNLVGLKDIGTAFEFDIMLTTVISILFILLVVMLTYRSLLLPFIIMLVIQSSVWISFSVNTLTGSPMFFMAYIIASCIQMGATIDYGIILSSNYIEQRKTKPKLEALSAALKSAIGPIMTSGLVLIIAGITIGTISTSVAVSSIGNLLWRGTLVSLITVLAVLPQILLLTDKYIEKTTLKARFFKNKALQSGEK